MRSKGRFLVDRNLRDSWLWETPLCRQMAWLDLIAEARWEAGKVEFGGRLWSLERGELVVSTRGLAERWGWSRNRVKRLLAMLEEADAIRTQERTHQGTRLKIRNYGEYQRFPTTGEPTGESAEGPQKGHSRTHPYIEETKVTKGNEGNSDAPEKLVSVPLGREYLRACEVFDTKPGADDWRWLQELVSEDRYEPVDLPAELTNFSDYWSDQASTPKSIKRAIRRWLQKALEIQRKNGNGKTSSRREGRTATQIPANDDPAWERELQVASR